MVSTGAFTAVSTAIGVIISLGFLRGAGAAGVLGSTFTTCFVLKMWSSSTSTTVAGATRTSGPEEANSDGSASPAPTTPREAKKAITITPWCSRRIAYAPYALLRSAKTSSFRVLESTLLQLLPEDRMDAISTRARRRATVIMGWLFCGERSPIAKPYTRPRASVRSIYRSNGNGLAHKSGSPEGNGAPWSHVLVSRYRLISIRIAAMNEAWRPANLYR